MALLRDALSSLPAKPALVIAPLLVVLVLSLYYRDQYNQCSSIRQQRAALGERLRSMKQDEAFRLAEFTQFQWNKLRIVAPVKTGTIAGECPLDWNWAGGERESLIASGLLSALIFGHQGKVVGYLELRSDEVAFENIDIQLTPETAVFRVGANAGTVTLSLSGNQQ